MRLGLTAILVLSAPPLVAQDAPCRDSAEAFVKQLDNHFNAGDHAKYLASFTDEHHLEFYLGLRQLLESLALFEGLKASSRVLDYFVRGPVGIVAVETSYSRGGKPLKIASLIGVQKLKNQKLKNQKLKSVQGRFSLRFDLKHLPVIRGNQHRFLCPACNYEIRYDHDWLAVPVMPTTSGCMEALLLLSMRHDLHVETAVHIGLMPTSARKAIEACIESERAKAQLKVDDAAASYQKWRPRAFTEKKLPRGMTTIRAIRHCKKGLCSELNLIAMGRLRYLLVVRGTHDALKMSRNAVDAVLGSFRLLNPKATAKDMALVANHAHTGKGTLSEDNRYTNSTYDLSFQGPKNWIGTVHAGPWLFQLRFECPLSDARLHVRVLPRLGHDWSTRSVDKKIRSGLARRGRRITSAATTSLWKTDDQGFQYREFHTAVGDGKPSHAARYSVRKDMLVIVDGTYSVPAAKNAIEKVLGSLKSLK